MSLGRLGSYEILERIGQGGVGVVFKARDTRLDRVVALKVLDEGLGADQESRARLMREARAEASLSHANIATCFEVGEAAPEPPDLLAPGTPGPHAARVPFLAMEYVAGEDLLALIERKPLPIPQVLDYAVQIAAGLDAAHEAHVLHRDLKPGNVRVTPAGQVKILDFGLARILKPRAASAESQSFRTSEGRVMGTAPYMAPEQARGEEADARGDLYSFGVLLYQTATGRLPFSGGSAVEIFYAAASEEPPPLARFASHVPEELERIVQKLLAKRPADRYQSAHEVHTDLRLLRDGRTPSSHTYRRGARARARLVPLSVAAVLVLAVVAAIAWWMARGLFESPSRNLAVLAFEGAGGDSALALVGAGLAEDLRIGLVQHTDLNVASRAATTALPPGDRTPRRVGRELGVGSILAGAVRRTDAGPRLEVELVDARSGYVRWSGTYDLAADQALRVERDMLQKVAARLGSRAGTASSGGTSGTPTRTLRAYDDYTRGMQELQDVDDPRAADRATDRFAVALAQDPEFALAWAGRAGALLRIYKRDKRPEALRSAEQAADQALRLAPDLVEAHVARAEILRATGRTDEAIAELKQVVAQRPRWDEGCVQLAATYRDAGRLADAERLYRQAVRLRPDYWRNWNSLGAILFRQGDYAGARAAFGRVVQLVPDKNRGYEQLAAVDVQTGNVDRAIAEYRRLPTPVTDGTQASNIGTALFYAGRLAEAQEFYALAVRTEPNNSRWRQNLGDCYTRQGRGDEARAAYREAIRLADAELLENPGDTGVRLERAVCLAKTGDCEAAAKELARVGTRLAPGDVDGVYDSAKIHGLCGRRAQALALLKRAIALGKPARAAAQDDEFEALRADPEFRRLTGGR